MCTGRVFRGYFSFVFIGEEGTGEGFGICIGLYINVMRYVMLHHANLEGDY